MLISSFPPSIHKINTLSQTGRYMVVGRESGTYLKICSLKLSLCKITVTYLSEIYKFTW